MNLLRVAFLLSAVLPLAACTPTIGEGKTAEECVDEIDNDEDGAVDCEDDGCSSMEVCGGTTDTSITSELPEDAEICINEFVSSNSNGVQDESGSYPDWIELYNLTSSPVDLTGYTITDDLEEKDKHVLGADYHDDTGDIVFDDTVLVVPADGYLLLYADDDEEVGTKHLNFGLSKAGEEIGLYRPDGTALDRVTYGNMASNWSNARIPDGGSSWEAVSSPTPEASN